MTTSDQSKMPESPLDGFGTPILSPLYSEPPFEYRDGWSQLFIFKSDPAVLRMLLPEPLVADPEGTMTLTLSEFKVSGFGAYHEAILCASATLDGEAVNHGIYVVLDNDIATGGGREIWGFPKKIGRVNFRERDGVITTQVERGGIDLIDAAFEFGPLLGNDALDDGSMTYTNYKLIPSVKSGSAPEVQQLTKFTLANVEMKKIYRGRASLKFNESPVDALHKLPVIEVVDAFYYHADFTLGDGEIVHDYLKD